MARGFGPLWTAPRPGRRSRKGAAREIQGDTGPRTLLNEFFYEAVVGAMRKPGLSSSQHTEFYGEPLAGFATTPLPDQPWRCSSPRPVGHPGRTGPAPPRGGRPIALRQRLLEGSLSRRLIDVDYYIRIGGSAYRQLADLPAVRREPGVPSPDVFGKPAPFAAFRRRAGRGATVGAVTQRRRHPALRTVAQTEASRIERRLRARGVVTGNRNVQ